MRSASVEWMARVAARNEIETAKALAAVAGRPPYRVALSADSASRGGRDGTEREVAR